MVEAHLVDIGACGAVGADAGAAAALSSAQLKLAVVTDAPAPGQRGTAAGAVAHVPGLAHAAARLAGRIGVAARAAGNR